MTCEACGAHERDTRIIQHHWSYEKQHAHDLIPLCDSCHRRVHSGSLAEPRTGRTYEAGAISRSPNTGVRLGKSRLRSLEALVPTISALHPSLKITRADVHRTALDIGLKALEQTADAAANE